MEKKLEPKKTKPTVAKTIAKTPKKEVTEPMEQKTPYCQYKYTFEDNLAAALFVYKINQGRGKKFTLWALIVGFACSVFLIVMDIIEKNTSSLIFDGTLMGFLVLLTIFIFIMPLLVKFQQKKYFQSAQLDKMDYVKIDIEKDNMVEDFVQNGISVTRLVQPMSNLTAMSYDDTRIVLVFGKINIMVIKNDALKNITVDEFKTNMLIQLDINKQAMTQPKTPAQAK